MTAALMFEPSDPPTPQLETIPRAKWERMALTLGAVILLDPAGGPAVVVYNGRHCVAAATA